MIHYFSSHPAAFAFLASLPPYNITLSPANKAYHSLSDFQTSTGAATHATFDTEQLIPDTRVTHVDAIAFLQGSDAGVIAASAVHELLPKTNDTLDSVVSKQVDNTTCILAYIFNSASRQHCDLLASKFPFLNNIKDTLPPSEAYLYVCINWSLAWAHQQCSLGFPSH